jgi:hypothetical protein
VGQPVSRCSRLRERRTGRRIGRSGLESISGFSLRPQQAASFMILLSRTYHARDNARPTAIITLNTVTALLWRITIGAPCEDGKRGLEERLELALAHPRVRWNQSFRAGPASPTQLHLPIILPPGEHPEMSETARLASQAFIHRLSGHRLVGIIAINQPLLAPPFGFSHEQKISRRYLSAGRLLSAVRVRNPLQERAGG